MHHWVLAVGLLATFAVALGLYLALGEHDREQFANAVESTQDRIQGRIDDYVIALLGVRGLLSVTLTAIDILGNESARTAPLSKTIAPSAAKE